MLTDQGTYWKINRSGYILGSQQIRVKTGKLTDQGTYWEVHRSGYILESNRSGYILGS